MVYWRMFWWKGVSRVGREKERREVTRWTVSTTDRRRRSLKSHLYVISLSIT